MVEFPGPLVPARPAATVLPLRPSGEGFQVLMVRRAVGSEFMGNAYVFPGGSVDEADRGPAAAAAVRWEGDPEELPWRAAALRELHEEAGLALTDPRGAPVESGNGLYRALAAAGVRLDARQLHWVSRWITPEGLPRRFDTRFYVAEVGEEEAAAAADGVEVFDDTWVAPSEALSRSAAGEWEVPFPTLRHLEMLTAYRSIDEVLAWADGVVVESVLPRIVVDDNGAYSVLLPGEQGYRHEVDR
ncbi:MAG: NUDIX domain-containing protein [Actinobacteria bacterium]|nr:NUDIX domain-containing protein [Actinomycetota bacterium]